MKFLTRQEQLFLAAVIGLLLLGLVVKYYRMAHPAETGPEGGTSSAAATIQ